MNDDVQLSVDKAGDPQDLRQPWETPELKVYGNVESLTLGSFPGRNRTDASSHVG